MKKRKKLKRIVLTKGMIEKLVVSPPMLTPPDLTLTLKDGRIIDVFIIIKERKFK